MTAWSADRFHKLWQNTCRSGGNTTSVNADTPSPRLLAHATTKEAIQDFAGGLAQLLAEKGIRVNCVAPGPIWTPPIPSTMPPEKVKEFGSQVPMKRSGQPKELVPVYVMHRLRSQFRLGTSRGRPSATS